jgi:hypothetical protein
MSAARWIFATVAALSLAAGCSNDSTGAAAQPGTLHLTLTTPHPDDGAFSFQVSGPAFDSATVAVGSSLRLFTLAEGGATLRGAVVGALATGAEVTLYVPDVGSAGRYTARVIEVADRQNVLRASLAGYALAIAP